MGDVREGWLADAPEGEATADEPDANMAAARILGFNRDPWWAGPPYGCKFSPDLRWAVPTLRSWWRMVQPMGGENDRASDQLAFGILPAVCAAGLRVCLGVVFSSHIVRMAFYLVLSLGATAGLFFLAGADFVGSMQLLIYVGGTLVLLVFGVMLTAQGPFISMKTSSGDWILAALVGGSLLAVLLPTAFKIGEWQNKPTRLTSRSEQQRLSRDAEQRAEPSAGPTATRLGMGLLGARVDRSIADRNAS